MSLLPSACSRVPLFVLVFPSLLEHSVAGAAAAQLQESAVLLYLDSTLIGSQCLRLNPFYVCVSEFEMDARMPHLSE